MTKLLVCVDGSPYADNIITHVAWAAKRLNAEIDLLHVLRLQSDYNAQSSDRTGTIGINARSSLMEELVKVDQERGKLDQQKGRLILEHAQEALQKVGVQQINSLYRRGSLADTITEFENDADIIFIGKRGETANSKSELLGSNLEKVARSVHKPLFLVSRFMRPIHKFIIAYDGKDNANKAVEFACHSDLLKGLECHIITIGSDHQTQADEAVRKLKQFGFTVISHNETSGHIEDVIKSYVEGKEIDLLLMGAYSHSRVRTMLLGSTTAKLIKSCHVPVMLFR
jgi:Universal stress protein UspA and related nucleotide-binding proteins